MWLPRSENPTQKKSVPLLEYESSRRIDPLACNFRNHWLNWTLPLRPGVFHPSSHFRLTFG
jgi:hypothetical protein